MRLLDAAHDFCQFRIRIQGFFWIRIQGLKKIKNVRSTQKKHQPIERYRYRYLSIDFFQGIIIFFNYVIPGNVKKTLGSRFDEYGSESLLSAPYLPKVGGDVLHGLRQQIPQGGQLLLVVLHGLGEVHQVVQVQRVVFRLGVVEVHVVGLVHTHRQPHMLRPHLGMNSKNLLFKAGFEKRKTALKKENCCKVSRWAL